MSNKKLERVLQLIINEETDKASDLLHDIFVEKARNIYLDMVKEDEDLENIMSEADDEYDFDVSDMEDDLEDDVAEDVDGYDSEIDAEEMYEEEDDMEMGDEMDDAEMDLGDEMGGEEDEMEFGAEEENEGEEGPAEHGAEEAFMNVEDALEELKSYFAELTGGEEEMEDEESEDEFGAGEEYEYDEGEGEGEEEEADEEGEIKESVQLKKVNAPANKKSDDGKASPVAKNGGSKLGKPMKDAIKTATETGGKAAKPKELGVPGPEKVGTTLRKMKG